MKRYPIILSLLTVIYSCHNSAPATGRDNATATDSATVTGHATLAAYQQWISSLDTQKIDNVERALQRFEQSFHHQSPDVCDTAFTLFDRFHERVAEYIYTTRNADYSLEALVPPTRLDRPTKPLSPQLKRLLDTLTRNGYRVDEEEGTPYLVRDYTQFEKRFSGYLSPAMHAYLAQIVKEDREGFQDDAALTIPPDSLAARAVWWEAFTRSHPKFIYAGKAEDNLIMYRFVLINGTDNTSVQTEDHLSDYYAGAYSFIEKTYASSPIYTITNPYYKAWQNRDTAAIREIREKNSYTK